MRWPTPLSMAALALTAATTAQGERSGPGPVLDWALVYVMSYDNDLERCGPVILDGLERGVTSAGTRVLVLHDDRDRDGLRRWVIDHRGRAEQRLVTDDIASEAVIADFLAWVAAEHPARRYAVVFLDHGGDLDQMCLDEWTGRRGPRRWLSARKMGPVLRAFGERAPGEVELLFLQQCGRGSIDNLYNFRGAAKAVMASQLVVGAPNTYYTPTLRALCAEPSMSAVDLAKKVMQTDEHFTHYVCVDGARLAELPDRLAPVVETIIAGDAPALRGLRPCFGSAGRGGESNYDLLAWLEAAAAAAGLDGDARRPLAAFGAWVEHELILAARARRGPLDVCGLSLFVPVGARVRMRYRDYPLRAASRLGALWDAMYPPPRQR